MAENFLIAGLSMSIMFNVLIIIFLFATGMGKDIWQRFIWKRLHRRGGYVYTLMATRDGIIKEVFAKVKEGKFNWNDQDYVREPKMMRLYRGIPANFHREGIPAPIDPWSDDVADFILSCGELDTVMNSQQEFDFRKWVDDNKMLFVLGLLVIVGLLGAAVYFGYMNYQIVRDSAKVVATAAVSAK